VRHDTLSDMFSTIKNAEMMGKKSCVTCASKLIKGVLKIMQKHGYIGNFEFIDDGKSGKFKIELLGRINDCKVIRPRFYIKKDEFIKWEKKFLPFVNGGLLLLTTSQGIMDHREAKKAGIGGGLLGYVY